MCTTSRDVTGCVGFKRAPVDTSRVSIRYTSKTPSKQISDPARKMKIILTDKPDFQAQYQPLATYIA